MSDDDPRGDHAGINGPSDDEVVLRVGDRSISRDVVFDLVADRRRRIVLNYLVENPGVWVPRDVLIDLIVDWETRLGEDAPHHRKNVSLAIDHVHIPKLEGAGVVECDEDYSRIRYTGSDRLETVVDVAADMGETP